MVDKIKKYIQQNDMLHPGETVIAGVSGGADSVCLLVILDELRKDMDLKIMVVHINHGLRGEAADQDEAYVRNLCGERQIPCRCDAVDVRAYAEEHRCSEEEAGRLLRRAVFEKEAERAGGAKIALAHHQDDNAETFLLHAARGSRLKGLGGIYPVNGSYIRPLLCVDRKEIEEFLKKKGIPYCMDATNTEDTYTRNRIRRHVLPYLESYVHGGAVKHLNGAMEQLRELQGYMERQTQKACAACVETRENGILIRREPWMAEDRIIQPMVVHRVLAESAGREKDLTEAHVRAVSGLMERQTGRKLSLPYALEAERTYEGVLVRARRKEPSGAQEGENTWILPVKEQSRGQIRAAGQTISWRVFPAETGMESIPKKTYTKWFDYGIINENLCVRTRKPGDRIVIDREGHRQKLKAYFINEKIPSAERERIQLFAEGSDILWVAGHRQSGRYQVTEWTKDILEITIDGGNSDGRKD